MEIITVQIHPLDYDNSTANENVERSTSRNDSQWESRRGGRFVVVVDFLCSSVKSINCSSEVGRGEKPTLKKVIHKYSILQFV